LIDATSLQIGNSGSVGAAVIGSLTLGSGGQIVSETTVVGRNGSSSLTTQASLTLNKASLTVASGSGTLTVNSKGEVDATVGTTNLGVNQGGITIINTGTAALTINSLTTDSRGIQFTFENFNTSLWEIGNSGNFDAIYYGILWQGVDRIAAINTLITASKLSADTSAIFGSPAAQVFMQGADTYYGFYLNSIPEPNTAVLLALSLTAVMVLRRRRSNS